MRKELSELTGLTREQVDFLFENGIINYSTCAPFLVRHEYKKLMEQGKDNSTAIMVDLAIRFRKCESTIYKWVKYKY